VARFAIELNWTEKKAKRIRNLANVTAAKRTKNRRGKPVVAEVTAPVNALKRYADFRDVDRPQDGQTYSRMVESEAWVQDFTHIWYMGMWIYVDLCSYHTRIKNKEDRWMEYWSPARQRSSA
jgi:transposase InsO family protein